MITTPDDFMPRVFDVPEKYRNGFDLHKVETVAGTLTDDDTLLYLYNMVFGHKLKTHQLSEKEVLGTNQIPLEKTKIILSDIINNPGERLHHAAQMEVKNTRELGDRGVAIKVLLSVADKAFGLPTEFKIINRTDDPTIPFGVKYVVQQWFTTDRQYQLPQAVLRESALIHGISVGGWREATFPNSGLGFTGSLLGNVIEGEKPFIYLPSFTLPPKTSEV